MFNSDVAFLTSLSKYLQRNANEITYKKLLSSFPTKSSAEIAEALLELLIEDKVSLTATGATWTAPIEPQPVPQPETAVLSVTAYNLPAIPESCRSLPTFSLDMPFTLVKFLTTRGYKTVGQIEDAGAEGLMAIPRFGHKKLVQVRTAFKTLAASAAAQSGAVESAPLTLDEWVATLGSRSREIIELRFAGKTLQETGDHFGITRERIRQIESKALKDRPPLTVDAHRHLFDTYRMTSEEFCRITGESPTAFYYLTATSRVKVNDRAPLAEALHDEALDESARAVIAAIVTEHEIADTYKSPSDIIESLAPEFVQETSVEQVQARYRERVDELGLANDRRFRHRNNRLLEMIIARDEHLLMVPRPKSAGGGYVRFYDASKYDFAPLVELLKSDDFTDIECSSALVFNNLAAPPVLEALDIRNFYELHVIIRRYCPEMEGVSFGRIPTIIFGHGDRMSQTIALIKEIGPVDAMGLSEEYSRRYGVDKLVFRGNLKGLSAYQRGNMFVCVDDPLGDDEVEYLKAVLDKPYYVVDQVRELLATKFAGVDAARIATDASRFGYCASGDLLIKEGVDASELFTEQILSSPEFATGDDGFERAVVASPEFTSVLNSLERAYKVVEYEKDRYVTHEYLAQLANPISRELMQSYVESVLAYVDEDVPFTTKSLRVAGFDHPLQGVARKNGFGDKFLSSLLSAACTVGTRLRRSGMNGASSFCKTDRHFSFNNVLLMVANSSGAGREPTVPWVIDVLEKQYGIEISGPVLRTYAKRVGITLAEKSNKA